VITKSASRPIFPIEPARAGSEPRSAGHSFIVLRSPSGSSSAYRRGPHKQSRLPVKRRTAYLWSGRASSINISASLAFNYTIIEGAPLRDLRSTRDEWGRGEEGGKGDRGASRHSAHRRPRQVDNNLDALASPPLEKPPSRRKDNREECRRAPLRRRRSRTSICL